MKTLQIIFAALFLTGLTACVAYISFVHVDNYATIVWNSGYPRLGTVLDFLKNFVPVVFAISGTVAYNTIFKPRRRHLILLIVLTCALCIASAIMFGLYVANHID